MPKKEDFIKNLGKHIDKLRQERKWSFQEMANACEMDKAQVYKICTNGVDLRVSSIEKLAKGFGITPSELLNF
jgi:transcriptional regulator with XRE-family HTH domain